MADLFFDASIIGPWVCERTGGQWNGEGACIGMVKDGAIVAGVIFDHYNGQSACMHVASDGSRHWLTRKFLETCFDYPFNQLKLKKVIGLVDSMNIDALKFDKHLGFVEEAVIKDAGAKGDLHILTMTRQQCRFLKD